MCDTCHLHNVPSSRRSTSATVVALEPCHLLTVEVVALVPCHLLTVDFYRGAFYLVFSIGFIFLICFCIGLLAMTKGSFNLDNIVCPFDPILNGPNYNMLAQHMEVFSRRLRL